MANLGYLSLQKALFLKLSGDSALQALTTGVHDRAPQNSEFPYVVIGDMEGKDWSTKTTSGTEYLFEIQVWSREGGRKEAATIMERIYQLLHDGSMTVENNSLVLMRLVANAISLENDGWTYLGTMQFRALLQSN
jgi:hypothetical protein